MILKIISEVDIDLEVIKDLIDKGMDKVDAVEDYISGFDDSEYYLIGCSERQEIYEELRKQGY